MLGTGEFFNFLNSPIFMGKIKKKYMSERKTGELGMCKYT